MGYMYVKQWYGDDGLYFSDLEMKACFLSSFVLEFE